MTELLRQLGDITVTMPSLPSLLFHLLLAFVLSTPLAWVYAWTHHGMSYSRSFVQSLVLLAMIVAIVMLAIGDSVARAFGLFGALALIRFRTPIKDSRDTVFLFLSVAIGITVGVQNTTLAVAGTATTLLVAVYLNGIGFGQRQSHDGVLRFKLPAADGQPPLLATVLRHYCHHFALAGMRESPHDGALDYTYQLRLFDTAAAPGLVTDIRAIPGAADVQVLMQNEHEEI
ncbi:MAG: DUF4956 domain-containing protein [Planctomycetes bacterium]|nr:DUF4956 domain-containing protein [Planctomycetota bacterium]